MSQTLSDPVVTTLPAADEQALRTLILEILRRSWTSRLSNRRENVTGRGASVPRDLMDYVLVFDRQRSIVRSHFLVVLPRYLIGRFFCSLLEHASALGKFLCVCHLTPHAEQELAY